MNGVTAFRRASVLTAILTTALLGIAAGASGGPIDRDFGVQGLRSLDLGVDQEFGYRFKHIDSAAGPNGEVFVLTGGSFRGRKLSVANIKADGRRDRSFGRQGFAYLTFPSDWSVEGGAVATDRQGRVLLTTTSRAECGPHGCTNQVVLLRLDRKGRLDPAFRGGRIYRGIRGTGQGLLTGKNGAIFVGGDFRGAFSVSRFHADGRLDRSFGKGGTARVETESKGARTNWLRGMTRDRKGRFVLAATTGENGRTFLGRINADGTPDRSFGEGGTVRTGRVGDVHDVIAMPNGRLIVGWTDWRYDGRCSSLFAFTEKGAIDTSFNRSSEAAVAGTCDPESPFRVKALRRDRQGRITAIGGAGKRDFAAEKYVSDGSRIAGYGEDGVARFDGGRGQVSDGVIDSAGRVVAVGSVASGDERISRVGRFTLRGGRDNSFAGQGFTAFRATSPSEDEGWKVWPDGGGLVIAGKSSARMASNTGSNVIALSRLMGDGRTDRGFGIGGRVLTPFTAHYRRAPLVAFSNGSAFAGGPVFTGTGDDFRGYFAISKFDRTGSPVAGWGENGTTGDGALGRGYPERLIGQPDGGLLMVNLTRNGAELKRVTPAGEFDRDYGIGGTATVVIPHDPTAGLLLPAVSTDARGLPLLAFTRGVCGDVCGPTGTVLVKLDSRGRVLRSFGDRGQATMRIQFIDAVYSSSGNPIVVAGTRCVGKFDWPCRRERVVVVLGAEGRRDAGFGRRGQATFPLRRMKVNAALATSTGIVLGGRQAERPALLALTRRGKVARSWGRGGYVRLKAGLSGEIRSITRTPGGRLIAAGTLRTYDRANDFLTVGFRGP